MRKRISIVSVVLALTAMLAAISVPHHHHGAVLCMAVENHANAGRDSAAEHQCPPQEHRDSHCVAESEYTVQRDDSAGSVHIAVAKPDNHKDHIYTSALAADVAAECPAPFLTPICVNAPRGSRGSVSCDLATAHALRGPPCAC